MSRAKERSLLKQGLGIDVLTAARQRVAWVFDTFPCIYISGPSGKDSGVMMHLVCQEARLRGRKVGVFYMDLEAHHERTISWLREMFAMYADVIDLHWLALPIRLRNAVSQFEPYWIAWDPERRADWVRPPPPEAVTDWTRYPWYRPPWRTEGGPLVAMEFEEIYAEFGHWWSGGKACACFIGLRTDESLTRWRAMTQEKSRFEGRIWTTWKGRSMWNVYPIYDWATEDIWTFHGKTGLPYNTFYDLMYQAGVPLSQMRICQPFGDDQRRGLAMYHAVDPEMWTRLVGRVAGANMGAIYCGVRGNVLGNGKVVLPPGHTWESYVRFLLDTMPPAESEHYKDKIAVFVQWWRVHRGVEMVDEADPKLEASKQAASWRRVAKVILKNDRLCKGLSFGQQLSTPSAFNQYRKVMRARRRRWGIFPD